MVGVASLSIAVSKVELSFVEALVRGILVNWLVCLAVWLSFATRDLIGKVIGLAFPIAAFVAMGFEHSIANMYFIPLGLFLKGFDLVVAAAVGLDLGNLTWGNFFLNNLLPVTIGVHGWLSLLVCLSQKV